MFKIRLLVLMTQSSGEKFKNIIFNSIEMIWECKCIRLLLKPGPGPWKTCDKCGIKKFAWF